MIPVRLLLEAEDDLAEAAAFLEERVEGLGVDLTVEVEHAISRPEENSYVGPHLERGYVSCGYTASPIIRSDVQNSSR